MEPLAKFDFRSIGELDKQGLALFGPLLAGIAKGVAAERIVRGRDDSGRSASNIEPMAEMNVTGSRLSFFRNQCSLCCPPFLSSSLITCFQWP